MSRAELIGVLEAMQLNCRKRAIGCTSESQRVGYFEEAAAYKEVIRMLTDDKYAEEVKAIMLPDSF